MRRQLNEMTTSAAGGTPDLQTTLYAFGDDERHLMVLNPYAGYAFGVDEGGSTTAIADLGVNLVRHEGEQYDLAVGLHVDTGGSYGSQRVMGYLMGLGGEVSYDKEGRLGSVGAGFGLFKFNYKLRPTAEAVEASEASPRPLEEPGSMPSSLVAQWLCTTRSRH
jgi:hypothetical protein